MFELNANKYSLSINEQEMVTCYGSQPTDGLEHHPFYKDFISLLGAYINYSSNEEEYFNFSLQSGFSKLILSETNWLVKSLQMDVEATESEKKAVLQNLVAHLKPLYMIPVAIISSQSKEPKSLSLAKEFNSKFELLVDATEQPGLINPSLVPVLQTNWYDMLSYLHSNNKEMIELGWKTLLSNSPAAALCLNQTFYPKNDSQNLLTELVRFLVDEYFHYLSLPPRSPFKDQSSCFLVELTNTQLSFTNRKSGRTYTLDVTGETDLL